MPLVKGKKARSKKGFSENVKREMKEGKPQKQSVAIAYSEADRGMKGKKKKHKSKVDDVLGRKRAKKEEIY